jgi:hypothetical protein
MAWQRRLALAKRKPKLGKASKRPTKGLSASASTTVAARIHRDDYEALRERAATEQITPGEILRRALQTELARKPV